MKDLLVACTVAAVAISVTGFALAGDAKRQSKGESTTAMAPILLTDSQMEKIIAGGNSPYVVWTPRLVNCPSSVNGYADANGFVGYSLKGLGAFSADVSVCD